MRGRGVLFALLALGLPSIGSSDGEAPEIGLDGNASDLTVAESYPTKCEFLAVGFDGAIAFVDTATFSKLFSVTVTELGPRNAIALPCVEQIFARCQIRHPNVITDCWQAPPAEACRENAQSIFAAVNRRMHRFRSDHGFETKR